MNWGFTAFEAVKLFDAKQAVVTPRVWKGAEKAVPLGHTTPIVVALPAGSVSKLRTEVVRSEPLVAPIASGQAIGTLKIYVADQLISEVPLLALEPVAQAGVLGRAWDAMRLWVR